MIKSTVEVCYVSRGAGILPERVITRFVTFEENGKMVTRIDLQTVEKLNREEFASSEVYRLQ